MPALGAGERIERYIGDHWAKVDHAGSERDTVLRSFTPLRARDRAGRMAPVALELRDRGGFFSPESSPSPVQVAKLGGRVTLAGSGLELKPSGAGAARVDAALSAGRGHFASVATDTDFVVVPMATGVELSWVLRSDRSPETLSLDLDLPAGTSLREAPVGGPGGLSAPALAQRRVELVKDGEAIAAIEAPHAVDADGTEVDVSMAVREGRLVLDVAHRDKDFRFPILVDPVVNDYLSWKEVPGYHDPSATYNGWYNDIGGCYAAACGSMYGYAGPSYHGSGLYAWGQEGHYFTGGRYSQWIWRAPGDAYIYRADFGWAHHDPANSNLYEGIYSYSNGYWENAGVSVPPEPGYPIGRFQPYIEPNYLDYDFKSHCQQPCGWGYPGQEAGTPGNAMVFGVQMRSNGWVGGRPMAYLGGAQVSLHEFNPPTYYYGDEGDSLVHTGLPTGWVRSANIHTEIAATDSGLGMKTIDLTSPTGWNKPGQPDTCNGARARTTDRPCPYYHNGAFDYNTDTMPEGIVPINATARDIVGNSADLANWQVKVDRTEPYMEMIGSLAVAQGHTLDGSSYDLTVTADDEDPDRPTSGVRAVRIFVDNQLVASREQVCTSTSGCPLETSHTVRPSDMEPGQHEIRVEAEDMAGNIDKDDWLVFVPFPEPALPPDVRQVESIAFTRIDGASSGDQAGREVIGLGDMNEDGLTDYAVGAPSSDPRGRQDAGAVYVIYGRKQWPAVIDLATLSAAQGFKIDGAAPGDLAGTALAPLDDVNGDSVPDLAIGAPRATSAALRGAVYVIFGSPAGDLDLAGLGSQGYRIDGPTETPSLSGTELLRSAKPFGSSLDGGGGAYGLVGENSVRNSDVNSDGRTDLIVGAAKSSQNIRLGSGSAYVIFGKADSGTVAVESLGSQGMRIDGAAGGNLAGYSVAIIGDANGDSRADLLVGAPGRASSATTKEGAGYVIYGDDAETVDLAALGNGGYEIEGLPGDELGLDVAAAGDMNRDELADAVVAGKSAYVSFGRGTTSSETASGEVGVRFSGPGPDLTVAPAADANVDTVPDLFVGAANHGRAWLVFGREGPYGSSLGELGGHDGITYSSGAASTELGRSLATVGGVRGLNAADAVFGAPQSNNNGRASSGSAFLLPGEEWPSCFEGYEPSVPDYGALVTCMDGVNQVAVDSDRDGETDWYRAMSPATAAARGPGGNKKGRRDTAKDGVTRRDGVRWDLRRTLVLAEVSSDGRRNDLSFGRLQLNITLSGNFSIHRGLVDFYGGEDFKQEPRVASLCNKGGPESPVLGCPRTDNILMIGKFTRGRNALDYNSVFRGMGGPGRFFWRYNVSAKLLRVGQEFVSYTPPGFGLKSKPFRCKKANNICLFRRPRR